MNVEQLLQANEAFRLDLARYQSSAAVSMNFGDMCLMHVSLTVGVVEANGSIREIQLLIWDAHQCLWVLIRCGDLLLVIASFFLVLKTHKHSI